MNTCLDCSKPIRLEDDGLCRYHRIVRKLELITEKVIVIALVLFTLITFIVLAKTL